MSDLVRCVAVKRFNHASLGWKRPREVFSCSEKIAEQLYEVGAIEYEKKSCCDLAGDQRFEGHTVVIAAGGPSLTKDQLDYCKGKAKVVVINNAFKLAPWADMLYACDGKWWEVYFDTVRTTFTGDLWTQDKWAMDTYGINRIKSMKRHSLSTYPRAIHQGSNSGYQALNLALHMGARKILLIGYDMRYIGKKRHWHGDHDRRLKNPAPATLQMFIDAFNTIKDEHLQGAEVLNCTPGSALDRFPFSTLEDELGEASSLQDTGAAAL